MYGPSSGTKEWPLWKGYDVSGAWTVLIMLKNHQNVICLYLSIGSVGNFQTEKLGRLYSHFRRLFLKFWTHNTEKIKRENSIKFIYLTFISL